MGSDVIIILKIRKIKTISNYLQWLSEIFVEAFQK